MKLRIRGNFIRLRLTKTEVEQLADSGAVGDAVKFGPSQLEYVISRSDAVDSTTAEFDGSMISVSIPDLRAIAWITSDEVGVEAIQMIDDSDQLRILIEKDFACAKDRPGEDDSDAFPVQGVRGAC